MLRRIALTLAIGAVLISLLLAGAWWLSGREATLQWALKEIAAASDGTLQIDGVSGSLRRTVRITRLIYRKEGMQVILHKLALTWSPHALRYRELVIDRLDVRAIHFTPGPADEEPATLPEDLTLPLRVRVNLAKIGAFVIVRDDEPLALNNIALRAQATRSQWQGEVFGLTSPWGELSGKLHLGMMRPFPVQAHTVFFKEQPRGYHMRAHVSGSLERLEIDAAASAQAAQAHAKLAVTPFTMGNILERADVYARQVNPAAWVDGAPSANLTLRARARGVDAERFTGQVHMSNALAGSIDQERLPLRALRFAFKGNAQSLVVPTLALDLGAAGQFSGTAQYKNEIPSVALSTRNFNVHGLHSKLHPTTLRGSLRLGGAPAAPRVEVDLRQDAYHLQLAAALVDRQVQVQRLRAAAGASVLSASGAVHTDGDQAFALQAALAKFNPAAFGAYPQGTINGRMKVTGQLHTDWNAKGDIVVDNSRLLDRPLRAEIAFDANAKRVAAADINVRLGDNRLSAEGSLGAAEDRLHFVIKAPALAQFPGAIAGSLHANGSIAGAYTAPRVDISMRGRGMQWGEDYQAETLNLTAALDGGLQGPIQATAVATNLATPSLLVTDMRFNAAGRRAQHRLRLTARGQDMDITLALDGGLDADTVWSGKITELRNEGVYPLRLTQPSPLTLGAQAQRIGPAALRVADGEVSVYAEKAGARIATHGRVRRFPVAYLLRGREAVPVRSTLTLAADWNIAAADTVEGQLHLWREGGDLDVLRDARVPLELSALDVRADINANALTARARLAGAKIGNIQGEFSTRLSRRGDAWGIAATAPLDINSTARLDSIAWTAALADVPGLDLAGALSLNVRGSGTVGAPRLRGVLQGSGLEVQLAEQGIALRSGVLDARFTDNQLVIDELRVQGGKGYARASGAISIAANKPRGRIALQLVNFQALDHPDRELVASGTGTFLLQEQGMSLDAQVQVDRGLIELPDRDAPTLSKDVVIVGADSEDDAPVRTPLTVLVRIDLGEDLYLRGKGIDAKLTGLLRVRGTPGGTLLANGRIEVDGFYSAYGQRLTIQRGALIFAGPIDNPGLDLLAVRENLEVEAGVAVTGTVLAPRAVLVSTPNVPDGEKLSWLVLGRGLDDASGEDFNLLSAAAGRLLSYGESVSLQAQIARATGLDEFGVKGGAGVEDTVVTLGKRIASKLYVNYEQSLNGAEQLAQLTYTLTPRWSVRTSAGSDSAVDVFYTFRFD